MIADDRRRIINHVQTERWLSNIPARYADLIRQAANATGFNIYTGEPCHAIPVSRYWLQQYVGVYTREPERDHGPFWAEYHRLKAETEQ